MVLSSVAWKGLLFFRIDMVSPKRDSNDEFERFLVSDRSFPIVKITLKALLEKEAVRKHGVFLSQEIALRGLQVPKPPGSCERLRCDFHSVLHFPLFSAVK